MTTEDRDYTPFEEIMNDGGSRSSHLPIWQETALLLLGAVILAVIIKSFFVQAFYIPSGSMEPTLMVNDRILVEKPSYWFGHPQRGDIVVFKDPGGWLGAGEDFEPGNLLTQGLAKIGLYPEGGHLVKRVIGVPGDVISADPKTGEIEVNGTPIDEKAYAAPGTVDGKTCWGPMPGTCQWTSGKVPAGELFVMGDNRAHSADSSYHLCLPTELDCSKSPWVDESLVVGKVVAEVWPMSRFKVLHRPSDFNALPR